MIKFIQTGEFAEAKSLIIASQERIKVRVAEDNRQIDQVCTEAEKKLKKVEKVVQQRVAILNETKANFAYIYEQLLYIKRIEQ